MLLFSITKGNNNYAHEKNNSWTLNNNKTSIMQLTKLHKHPQTIWPNQYHAVSIHFLPNHTSLAVLNISAFYALCHSWISKNTGVFWILASWANESMFFFSSLSLGEERRDLVVELYVKNYDIFQSLFNQF